MANEGRRKWFNRAARVSRTARSRRAEKLVKEGGELTVAYLEVDDGHSAAVDWPASTGARFS